MRYNCVTYWFRNNWFCRVYIGWQDFNGSTTTSYGATQGSQYYTKYNTTWDGT